MPTAKISVFLLAILPLSLAILQGCTEPPSACFAPSITLTDANAEVTFENCSEPVGKSYVWDFGDGGTSVAASPTHIYTTEGNYLVSLTAKAKSSINDDVTKTLIKVGQRIYTSSTISSLPATNPNGGAWDAGDTPDIQLRISSGTDVYTSDVAINPVLTYPFAVPAISYTVVLRPAVWIVEVLDVDAGGSEVMATFSVDLVGFLPNSGKSIALTDSRGSTISIKYDLR
jgi:PKD repeat protein